MVVIRAAVDLIVAAVGNDVV
ncbi:hypothetical protein LCGC14_3052670, partial [marine sediment metagenome]